MVFVSKIFTDANPGAECSIAPALSIWNLENNPTDLSSPDHGGIVQRDANGRLYVDVVLHNRRDATDNPIGDAWEDLEPSATYQLCLRKNPANVAAAAAAAAAAARKRQLMTIAPNWWEDGDDSTWIFIPTDIIHVLDLDRSPGVPPAPPVSPPAAPSHAWLWALPTDLARPSTTARCGLPTVPLLWPRASSTAVPGWPTCRTCRAPTGPERRTSRIGATCTAGSTRRFRLRSRSSGPTGRTATRSTTCSTPLGTFRTSGVRTRRTTMPTAPAARPT